MAITPATRLTASNPLAQSPEQMFRSRRNTRAHRLEEDELFVSGSRTWPLDSAPEVKGNQE